MSRVHWVRHGPTHAKTLVGWTDLPADLSNTAQLQRLSDHLPQDAVVISSDLIRAADTADAIAGNEKAAEVVLKAHAARAKMWGLANIPAGDGANDVRSKLLAMLTKG